MVNGASKDEVLLRFCLVQVAQLTNPIRAREVVISFNSKSMQANSELTKGDLEAVHPVLVHTHGPDNKAIP